MFCIDLGKDGPMDYSFTSEPFLVSFDTIYKENITPKLIAIDLLIKSTQSPYELEDVAKCLHISTQELLTLMEEHEVDDLNRLEFFTVLCHCSSYICRLIQRQWRYTYVKHYTPQMIAYIYELNIQKVLEGFESLGREHVYEDELMDLFSYIFVPIFTFKSYLKG
jgi:hypothetical protein